MIARQRLAFLVVASMIVGCGGAQHATNGPTGARLVPSDPCPTAHDTPPADFTKLEGVLGSKVSRVCVLAVSEEGRRAAEKAVVANSGDTLVAESVRRDLEQAMATGLFEDGRAWIEHTPAGPILVYDFVERPHLAAVTFEGSKIFGDEALLAKLPVGKGAVLEPAKMLAVATALEDEYHARGYLTAGVQLKATPAASGAVDVKYTIIEGPLHRIAKIAAKGAKRIPEAEVLRAAELTKGEPYTREKVERATHAVQTAYYDKGMVEAKVDAERDESTDAVGITFVIDEGAVFTIGKIVFKNTKPELERDLLGRMKAKPGQVFSRKGLVEELDRLSKFLGEKNLHGSLTPNVVVDTKKNTVDVEVALDFQ